jgi:hypothetical protein
MTKKELLKQLKQDKKDLLNRLANDDQVQNQNYKKGRRSLSQMFNNVNTRDKMV